jgi:hypothetical protein
MADPAEDGDPRSETSLPAAEEMAELPNAWIRDKIGLRKFHVRGLAKAGMDAVWACLTYNVQLWIRLIWNKPAPRAA